MYAWVFSYPVEKTAGINKSSLSRQPRHAQTSCASRKRIAPISAGEQPLDERLGLRNVGRRHAFAAIGQRDFRKFSCDSPENFIIKIGGALSQPRFDVRDDVRRQLFHARCRATVGTILEHVLR